MSRASKDPLAIPENRLDNTIERHIDHILFVCAGNKSRAAAILGIDRRSLQLRKTRSGK